LPVRAGTRALLVIAFLASLAASSHAASLQVSPVSLEVAAPGAAATITLRNEGTAPLNAQVRVFRWTQAHGEEKLEPTDDVVASPPIAALAPRTDYTVRLVRVSKRPVSSGESYRLLVDELPDPKARQNRVVTLVMRYSIPVFFYPREAGDAKLAWSVEHRDGKVYVSAANGGDRHVRIAALTLRDGNGATVSFGTGLTGYVLGRSTMRWATPGKFDRLGASGPIVISAQGDRGPINASPSAPPGR
jgi:fimbrial chaperone protein